MPDRTKEAEAFEDFCQISGALSSADLVQEEEPDFWHLTLSLGVELTVYRRDADEPGNNGSPRRRWEAQLEKLLEQVRAAYNAARTRRIDVYVHPRRDCTVTFSEGVRLDFLISSSQGRQASRSQSRRRSYP